MVPTLPLAIVGSLLCFCFLFPQLLQSPFLVDDPMLMQGSKGMFRVCVDVHSSPSGAPQRLDKCP